MANPSELNIEIRLLARQFISFAGVGVIGTAAHYAVLIALVQGLDVNAVIASSIGAVTGAIVNYYLNYHFTFRSNKSHHEAVVKFFIIAGIGFVLNGAIMALMVEVLGIYYLLSQIAATGLILIWNFAGNRIWTFKEHN